MIIVTRKDTHESTESLLRRFSRKVGQSGVLSAAKQIQYFEKSQSKRDRRRGAIARRSRRAEKTRKLKLGR